MDDLDRRALLGVVGVGVAGAIALNRTAHAGPLTPPGGVIAPTGKTITEAEPRIAVNATNTPSFASGQFAISQPGSYYLTANVQAGSGFASAITITASDVTLDLNGFSILGGSGALWGILVSGNQTNITLRNGSVRNFAGTGIESTNAAFGRFENLAVVGCAGPGLVTGDNALVLNCQAISNGSGVVGGGGNGSSGDGISVGLGSIVRGCTNRFAGSNGINARGGYSVITDCFVSDANRATSVGINAVQTTRVHGCQVSSCTTGIRATLASRIEACNVSYCSQVGILAEPLGGVQIVNNHIMGIGSAAGHTAIKIAAGVTGCVVEGNRLENNFRHIDVLSATHLIIRNTMSFTQGGTGVWSIAAGNSIGPLVSVGGVDHATVAASSHPQANLSW